MLRLLGRLPTARGLEITPAVLARVDEVIE